MPFITEQKVDVNYNKLELEPRNEPQLSSNNKVAIYINSTDNTLRFKTNINEVTLADNADVTQNTTDIQTKQNLILSVEDESKTDTLTIADSGKSFFLDSTTGAITINLPSAIGNPGINFELFVGVVGAGNDLIVTIPDSILVGGFSGSTITTGDNYQFSVVASGHTTITFNNATTAVGDSVYLISDGLRYFYKGRASVFNGVTLS